MANSKIIYGNTTLVDVTNDNVTANDVARGYTFMTSAGVIATGSAISAGGATVTGSGDYRGISMPGNVEFFTIPTWSSGSDADIAKAIKYHYKGIINLYDYWNIGDTRSVSLSAMSAMSPLTDTHSAQTVQFVLSEKGGKDLVTPINGHTQCIFQVDQLNSLSEGGGIDNGATSSADGWERCPRRIWCNTIYKDALPSTFASIFKEFVNYSGTGGSSGWSGLDETNDYFAYRSLVEITGQVLSSMSGEGTQVEWYKTASHIAKTSPSGIYFTRSALRNTSLATRYTIESGSVGERYSELIYGIAPFGVI